MKNEMSGEDENENGYWEKVYSLSEVTRLYLNIQDIGIEEILKRFKEIVKW